MLNACSNAAPRVRNLTNLKFARSDVYRRRNATAIRQGGHVRPSFTLHGPSPICVHGHAAQRLRKSYHLGARVCRATSVSVAHSRHTPTNPVRCPIAEHCTTSPCSMREAGATMLTRTAAATAVGAARVRRPIAWAKCWAHGSAPRGGARQAAASGDIEARRMLTEAMEREDEARVPALLHVSEAR
jgi:hypothetical protein